MSDCNKKSREKSREEEEFAEACKGLLEYTFAGESTGLLSHKPTDLLVHFRVNIPDPSGRTLITPEVLDELDSRGFRWLWHTPMGDVRQYAFSRKERQ